MNKSLEMYQQEEAREIGLRSAIGEAFIIPLTVPLVGPEGALKIVQSVDMVLRNSTLFDIQLHKIREKLQHSRFPPGK